MWGMPLRLWARQASSCRQEIQPHWQPPCARWWTSAEKAEINWAGPPVNESRSSSTYRRLWPATKASFRYLPRYEGLFQQHARHECFWPSWQSEALEI